MCREILITRYYLFSIQCVSKLLERPKYQFLLIENDKRNKITKQHLLLSEFSHHLCHENRILRCIVQYVSGRKRCSVEDKFSCLLGFN